MGFWHFTMGPSANNPFCLSWRVGELSSAPGINYELQLWCWEGNDNHSPIKRLLQQHWHSPSLVHLSDWLIDWFGIAFTDPVRYLNTFIWLPPPPNMDGGYVFTPVCLSVCLWAGYLKKLRTNSGKTRWTGWVYDMDELIRFWWRCRSRCSNILSDSSQLRESIKNDI